MDGISDFEMEKLYRIYLKSFSSDWVMPAPLDSFTRDVEYELAVALGKRDKSDNILLPRNKFEETINRLLD